MKTKWAKRTLGLALLAGAAYGISAIYKSLTKFELKGKVVLITGGSRGLGLILARQLAAKGARIAICARSIEQLAKAKDELKSRNAEVLALEVDITDNTAVQKMISDVVAHFGRLDVLINNAGVIQIGPQQAMQLEDYEKAMNVHFWGPLYTMNAAIPYFKGQNGGRIVNIASIGGKMAVPHLLPYVASKFALVGLSEGMHAELKKHKIIVTTVVPFLMRVGSPRNITVKGDHTKEYAWFKYASAMPMLVQDPDYSASRIIEALEYGEAELVLSFLGMAGTVLQGIAPGLASEMMALTNSFLPDNVEGGEIPKKGYESESKWSRGKIPSMADEAAKENNEL